MTDDKKSQYAEGGYIPGGSAPILINRGHTLMSYASYKALGPRGLKELFPNTDIELVFTADDVREMGVKVLEKLQQELDSDVPD